jgi:hypothetical protein
MYSTCIFCHSDLSTNDCIEHFPVGRRLVFDAARGRLWVVCRSCERWNLTPLEERWEAIDECERLFASTRLRVSTDNIGLARLREGLELVRIGSPLRPEMAVWRYGDQFGRRRRRHLAYTGVGVAIAAGLIIVGPATGIIAGSSWGVWNLVSSLHSAYQHRRVRARLILPEVDVPVAIRLKQLNRVRVMPVGDSWGLQVPFSAGAGTTAPLSDGVILQATRWNAGVERTSLLTGEVALQAAAKLLPAINASGAKRDEVDSALDLINEEPEPAKLFARYAADRVAGTRRRQAAPAEAGRLLSDLGKEYRLALEMATHEESERRALEGELALLEAEWAQAEEIAAIADDLFIPEAMRQRLVQLKSESGLNGGVSLRRGSGG